MAETRKKTADTHQPWWTHQWVTHPMTDEQFRDAFFEYTYCKSDDRSLRNVRSRARKFIDYWCKAEIERSLSAYRAEHPVD